MLATNIKFAGWSLVYIALLMNGASTFAQDTFQGGHPHGQLDKLDERIPVPLLPHMALHQKKNMREHLESVQGIISGLSQRNFKSIEASALKMGFSEAMGKMCERMGAGAPGFSQRAIAFHKSADEIADAARKFNEKAVMIALNNTLSKCTACHSAYRQQIVDEATLKVLTEKNSKGP